jgi:YbbR domain-containing protein
MAIRGFANLGLKVVSVSLAALIWLLVSGEQVVERALRIPIEFTNLPPQLEPVGETPNVVDVRVRGSSGALARVATGELVAVLDLRSARAGRRLFHLTSADVRAPFGIDVVQIAPSSLPMSFEPSATKTVRVVPEIEGNPAPGFAIGTVAAEPETVAVVGPASSVKGLTEAMTEPVSVEGATAVVTELVTVGVADPAVRLREPVSARVTVTVAPAQ